MSTTCTLATCACVLTWDEPLTNERNIIQKIRCRTHDTAKEALTHNRSFSSPRQKTEQEIDNERNKTQFKRR